MFVLLAGLLVASCTSCIVRWPYCALSPTQRRAALSATEAVRSVADDAAIALTKAWIEQHVLRLRLCPFASKPFVGDTIRYAVTYARDEADLLAAFFEEVRVLVGVRERYSWTSATASSAHVQ